MTEALKAEEYIVKDKESGIKEGLLSAWIKENESKGREHKQSDGDQNTADSLSPALICQPSEQWMHSVPLLIAEYSMPSEMKGLQNLLKDISLRLREHERLDAEMRKQIYNNSKRINKMMYELRASQSRISAMRRVESELKVSKSC